MGEDMKKVQYCYKGEYYGIAELSRMSGKSPSLIRGRLMRGWSIEDAVDMPEAGTENQVAECWRGKRLCVVFRESLVNVFPAMQPVLGVTYTANPGQKSEKRKSGYKEYFVIMLENGKPLIVYPGEFEIIGEAEE